MRESFVHGEELWELKLILENYILELCRGGNKEEMKKDADKHFRSVQQIIPEAKRLMIFDYDTEKTAFHPEETNEVLFEWKRKNIENYLLVPDAWKKAVRQVLGSNDNLFLVAYIRNHRSILC